MRCHFNLTLTELFFSNRLKTKQESDVLRSYLKSAQDDISILLSEKKALLETIRSMQVCINLFLFGHIFLTNTYTYFLSIC